MILFHGSTVNIDHIDLADFQYIKERLLAQMIQILMDEKQLSLEVAMDKVYTSNIFSKLSDPATGLYVQSPRYILSYIQ